MPWQVQLYVMLVVLILSRSIDYVLFVRLATQMQRYTWYLGSIILPIAISCIFWPVVWLKMKFRPSDITAAMRATPKWHFLLMGMLDSVAVVTATIPAPYLSGVLQVVLSQFVIPLNMILSFFFLKTRYRWTHGIGVALTVGGVLVALAPQFMPRDHVPVREREATSFVWIAMFLAGNVPLAISNVYKERFLQSRHLDVFYMNSYVALGQLASGVISTPLIFTKLYSGESAPIKPSELGTYLAHANACFWGVDSVPTDHCAGSAGVFFSWIGFNVTFTVSMLMVFRHGSATLAVVAGALRVAVSAFAFQIRFVAGIATRQVTLFDGLALAIMIGGVVAYRFYPEFQTAEPTPQERAPLIVDSGAGQPAAATSPGPADGGGGDAGHTEETNPTHSDTIGDSMVPA